ncbi:MAG: SBBP repeat-containing protein [Verrucomicrobia bacterium]|nr:SBBP repeat-containing protein [Verrucomicrobiota bacterium]
MEPLPGKVNYLFGCDHAGWRTNMPTFAKIKYSQVYPGVDLIYYGTQRQLEDDFIVAPDSDAGAIRLSFDGADRVEIDESGDLLVSLPGGQVRWRKPVAYQRTSGGNSPVACRYVFSSEGHFRSAAGSRVCPLGMASDLGSGPARSADLQSISIRWNRRAARRFWTAVAERSGDTAFRTSHGPKAAWRCASRRSPRGSVAALPRCAVSPACSLLRSDNSSVCEDFRHPADCKSAIQQVENLRHRTCPTIGFAVGDYDTTKPLIIDPILSFSTYLGGSAGDVAEAVAVDQAGNAYITGMTRSIDFPVTMNALGRALAGGSDAFVTKINSAGTALQYSTYLGSAADENALVSLEAAYGAIAVDASGRAWVTRLTASSNFPVVGARQETFAGGRAEAFGRPLTAA